MIILGIDPGSRIMGFGLIDNHATSIKYVHSGHIRAEGAKLVDRLGYIFTAIDQIIGRYHPEQMSIENVFMARNADSALKLGQARGAAICAAHQAGLEIAEYAPREVKQAVVGTGAASKEQIEHMVRRLLGLRQSLQSDEADGLALAICHAQHYTTRQKTGLPAELLKRRRGQRR